MSTCSTDCEVTVTGRMVNQRLAACPLEGRATAAAWDGERLTVWISSQGVHGVHRAIAGAVGLDRGSVRRSPLMSAAVSGPRSARTPRTSSPPGLPVI